MTTKRFTVAQEWSEFERRVLEGASKVQRDEMRKAFYCGAVAVWHGVVCGVDPNSTEATPADIDLFETLSAEFTAFAAEMRARAMPRGARH